MTRVCPNLSSDTCVRFSERVECQWIIVIVVGWPGLRESGGRARGSSHAREIVCSLRSSKGLARCRGCSWRRQLLRVLAPAASVGSAVSFPRTPKMRVFVRSELTFPAPYGDTPPTKKLRKKNSNEADADVSPGRPCRSTKWPRGWRTWRTLAVPYPVWFGHEAMGLGLGLLPLGRWSLRMARIAAFAERPCRL